MYFFAQTQQSYAAPIFHQRRILMNKLDSLAQDFLAQKKIAVVGVSDKRDTGCNMAYKKFKENGYQVYAVNPRISTYEGQTCYADLKSIPEKVDAVFILT